MSGTRAPNVAKCLGDAVQQGRLSQGQADEALSIVRKMMREHAMSEGEAAVRAAEQLKEAAERHQRQAALRVIKTDEALQNVGSHDKGIVAGIAAIFARDAWGRAGYSSVEGRARAVRGELHARFADGLDAFRSKTMGLTRDLPGLRDFVRALYDEKTGNAVAEGAAGLALAEGDAGRRDGGLVAQATHLLGRVGQQRRFTWGRDDHLGLCIGHDGLYFQRRQSPIQTGEDGADFVARKHELKTLGAVFCQQCHAVAHAHTCCLQSIRRL